MKAKKKVQKNNRKSPTPATVAIQPGRFVEVEEISGNNRPCRRLFVLEDKFLIRKYAFDKSKNGWFCCECKQKNRPKNIAMNFNNIKAKEAIKQGNMVLVAKNHASCKGFKLSNEDLLHYFPEAESTTPAENISIPQIPLSPPPTLAPSVPVDNDESKLASEIESVTLNSVSSTPQKYLYRTNSAGLNRVRRNTSGLIRTIPRPTETNITVSHRAEDVQSNCAAPSTLTENHVEANIEPSRINDNVKNPENESQIITEGTGNFGEENANILREILPIPEVVELFRRLNGIYIPDVSEQERSEVDESFDIAEDAENNEMDFEYEQTDSAENHDVEENILPEVKYDSAILTFNRPSDRAFKDACRALGLKYDRKAYEFWGTLKIEVVESHSHSIKSGQKLDGFACLALFLTGDSGK